MTKTVTGWWKVNFEINFRHEEEHERFGEGMRFQDLSETTQEHILKSIADGCFQGEVVEDYEIDEDETPCSCFDCPKKDCKETPSTCKNPCASCPMESDCYNDNTDCRSDCVAFSKFQKECEQENLASCNGGTNDCEEPVCEEYAENK